MMCFRDQRYLTKCYVVVVNNVMILYAQTNYMYSAPLRFYWSMDLAKHKIHQSHAALQATPWFLVTGLIATCTVWLVRRALRQAVIKL